MRIKTLMHEVIDLNCDEFKSHLPIGLPQETIAKLAKMFTDDIREAAKVNGYKIKLVKVDE